MLYTLIAAVLRYGVIFIIAMVVTRIAQGIALEMDVNMPTLLYVSLITAIGTGLYCDQWLR